MTTETSKKPRALAAIAADLEKCTALLVKATEAAKVADRDKMNATSKVNELQKEFDAVVEEMKKKAPGSTDWERERIRKLRGDKDDVVENKVFQPQGAGNAG